MARQYRAFMLRCWRLSGGDQRFEIAHIQSGESVRATTLDDALTWIGARLEAGHPHGDGRGETDALDDEAEPGEARIVRSGPL